MTSFDEPATIIVRLTKQPASLDGGFVAADRKDEFVTALTAQIPALRRYAMALVGNTTADDLVQDCIERALRQWMNLENADRIGAWLRSILHNLYVDERRRVQRQGVKVDLADVENNFLVAVPGRDAAASIDFGRAMGRLSFEHRQVLLLVGLEGLNYKEAANELSVPIGTVMSRLARARERLRQEMESPAASDVKR